MGYVYLLLEVDKNGGEHHKIGISKNNPEKRLKQLRTGNSNIISLLKIYETDNYKKLEKWLHRKFLNKKTQSDNEWFCLDNDDVLNFINTCKKIDDIITTLLEENEFYK